MESMSLSKLPRTLVLLISTTKELIPLCSWLFVMHTTGIECNGFDCTLDYRSIFPFRFTLVDIGEVGRLSDGGVLSNSSFGQALQAGTLCIPDPSPLQVLTAIVMCTIVLTYLFSRYYTAAFSLCYDR